MEQNKASGPSEQDGYNTMLDANAEARVTSARAILGPLFQAFSPTSVLDVGCGHGAWLQVCRELGADTIQGVDGPWIETGSLAIPASQFMAQALDAPLDLGRSFDLVMSLEVAEHLPESAADTFVDSLIRHGDIVLFSAAVPFQGAKSHINEQWQTYWAVKFAERGFAAIDLIRPAHWEDQSIFWWLRQNAILYVNVPSLSKWPDLQDQRINDLDRLSIVHPALYMHWVSIAGELSLKLEKALGS
ncbi:MAG: methyltransferase domain-containing protein [Alphaproteobacteria bacterium]|nr:methyltransferase domain-containing protein [Alphaproteobacteria bacterium]